MAVPTKADLDKREKICYLYWVHLENHTDISSEGYIGISNNPDYRFSQHKLNSKNPKNWHNYRTEFREALASDKCVMDVLLCSTREYCLSIESQLRPAWVIGWNIAKGGSGGFGKHGLTGTKVKKAFYNMLTRADKDGESVCPDWTGERGLEVFKEFYDSLAELDGEFTLKEKGMGYNPANFIKISRSEIIRRSYRKYNIGDDSLYSVEDLGDKFNLKPNTISSRIRSGWTVREAVGLDEHQPKMMCLSSGQCAEYSGQFSKDDIERMKDAYEGGKTTTQISDEFGVDVSNLLRFVKMFKFSKHNRKIRFNDFLGEACELGLKSKFNEDFIENFKLLVLDGKSAKEVAQCMNIPVRTVYHLKDILRWKEYERTMDDSKLTVEG